MARGNMSFETSTLINGNQDETTAVSSINAVATQDCPTTRFSSLDYTIEHLGQKQWNRRKKIHSNKNLGCGNDIIYNESKHQCYVAGCHQYSCSHCRPKKTKQLLDKVSKYAQENDMTRFLSITLPTGVRDNILPDDSFEYMQRVWNQVRKQFKRDFGVNLNYILFPRSHANGYCHFHALLDRYIPKSWLDNVMFNLHLGTSDIRYVDVQRVSAYLCSYLQKKEHEWFLPKNKKHYSMSANIHLEEWIPSDTLYFIEMPTNRHERVNCVYANVKFYTGKPPPFDFILSEFQENYT